MERIPSRWPRPVWHAPWKNYRVTFSSLVLDFLVLPMICTNGFSKCVQVISGHLGWVRSIAFDPSNEWFCTGSADRTIKVSLLSSSAVVFQYALGFLHVTS
jgi:pleiotropic regulator 1